MTTSARHQTKALLRAHLSAATGYPRHLTRHCPICRRLLRLAMESQPPLRPQPVLRKTHYRTSVDDDKDVEM